MDKFLSSLLRVILPRRFYVSRWTQSYLAWLEREIDRGTKFAEFEPNGEQLWSNVRRTVEDFLQNEFQRGVYVGNKPEQAYWVRCDRSTMTQNDLDNGRLICLVGVAPLRPAEFVIFRIGQWTASRKPDP
jgi:phage tail sheath protein FI